LQKSFPNYLIKIILTVSLFIGVTPVITAQEYKFSHITADQGLSMGVVNCMLRDSRGFMWFGTQDGLNKYDGYRIVVYKHNPLDSNSLSNNAISTLYENKNGELLIGTIGGGFDAYNLSTGRFTHYLGSQNSKNNLSNNNVKAILEDREGALWLGTSDGLNTYNPKTKKFIQYISDNGSNTISNNNVSCLDEGKDGRIWIGTYGGGLNAFNKKTNRFEHYRQLNSSGNVIYENLNLIRAIYEDKDGLLWIGTYGEGIQVFDTKSNKFIKNIRPTTDDNSLANGLVMSIIEDNNNQLWIATYGNGISLYNKKTQRFRNISYDEKNTSGLNSNQIRCVYLDNVGSIWVGTEGGGVNAHFRASNRFKFYTNNSNASNGLKSNIVLALLEDRDSLLWIGTARGGLATLDRETNTYTQYPKLSTGSNESILSLFEDRDGLIWVGTWGGGLNSYDKKTKKITSYPQFKSSKNGTVTCISQDKRGFIWIGTYAGGLFMYNKTTNKIKNYSTATATLNNDNIYHVFEDSKGFIWVATDGGGVVKLNVEDGIYKNYVHDEVKNSISSNSINCTYEDKQGNIWFGTANGLNKFNPVTGHFDHYFEKDGLPNDYIYSILPDNKGNLWMSTNKGVSKFNPQTNNENGEAFRNYDVNDGLQGQEFNQGAYCLSKSGELFLGGLNGFNAFYPDKIEENPNVPPVRLISYKRFGKEVILDTLIYDKKKLVLSYKQNFFSFDFVALDYQMPGKNKYSYKLEGINADWSPPSTERYASYTDIGGGDYIFRVRAANNDGIWNDEGLTLYITITPPFWKTNWFYTLSVMIVIAGVVGFFRWRTSSIKRENKVLEEKVKARTQELAQKNNDITSSIEYAKRIQLAILPSLDQVYKYFPNSFILYKPKDIVSGDFYWFGVKNGRKIIAAVDCTGHGVPGAFMSMIGHNLLNQIILENGVTQPNEILNALHHGVQAALKQGTNTVDTSDGMDIAICSIDEKNKELQFAGAHRPLFILNGNTFNKIDGDKYSIGGSELDEQRKFTLHSIQITKGDSVYMTSDGYADQFGGEKGKKFMTKRFYEQLIAIQHQTMDKQIQTLDQVFETWKSNYQQVDDILIIGIRL
jgi:ligand-binding sensor domain-containing protein/serine phosphatase RsbU (regulator of sigma subunit)